MNRHRGRWLLPLAAALFAASPSVSSDIEVFLEAYKLETTLNFNKVESERSLLLSDLLKKLTKAQSTELLNTSIAYRLGNLRHDLQRLLFSP